MANDATTVSPTVRGTIRETLITPVDEKRFESELRRVDSNIAGASRSQEKFETEVFRRFNTIDTRFEKIDARFERMDAQIDARFERMETQINARFERMDAQIDARFREVNNRLWWIMGAIIVSILIPLMLKYF
ncbi:MAG: hypothetical protein LBS00_11695 [Synergistaceae bacterium]|jgi:hypothetical protein|nr:hypothetical protein [Synergistaceae bacterium]